MFTDVLRDTWDVRHCEHVGCAALRAMHKHVEKDVGKPIWDVQPWGHCSNMCLNMSVNTFGMCSTAGTIQTYA